MSIVFDPKSAYKHFEEDLLDESEIRRSTARPEWFALVNPDDVSSPPSDRSNHAALIICRRHPGAWPTDLIEILARPQGRNMLVFHVEHLTDKWRNYWMAWRQ